MTKEDYEKAGDLFIKLDHLKVIRENTLRNGVLRQIGPPHNSSTLKRLEALQLQYLDECINALELELEKL